MKFYGTLIGSSGANAFRDNTAPNAKATPFTNTEAGTKAPISDENMTWEAMSRMFTALARNTELLRGQLGTPTLRRDRLEYAQTGGSGSFGVAGLAGVGNDVTEVSPGSGSAPQVTWLYHGLHKERVGRYLRAVTDASAPQYLAGAQVKPVYDVLLNAGGSSVFPPASHEGSTFRGLPSFVAPMRRVAPDLPPYSGSIYGVPIAEYGRASVGITAVSFADIYARVGCYVELSGAGSNSGLYRIEALTGAPGVGTMPDRAVLAPTGLHQITVDNVSEFTIGERVAWRKDDGGGAHNQVSFGYVMFISGLTLYVLPASASEEYPVYGTSLAVGVNNNPAVYTGRSLVGQLGAVDRETADLWAGLAGDLIWDSTGGDATIVDFVAAGEPVVLDPTVLGGTLYVVNPPGFALSPSLEFDSALTGGDYNVECYTLTTYRERIESGGVSASAGQLEEPGASLPVTELEAGLLAVWQKAILAGAQGDATSPSGGVNSPQGLPWTILGESMWELSLSKDGHANDIATNVAAGDAITITNSAVDIDDVLAEVVSVSTAGAADKVVLRNVRRKGTDWLGSATGSTNITATLIDTNSSFIADGDNYLVSSVDASPALETPAGDVHLAGGLSDIYANLHASDPERRTPDHGRGIDIASQKPVEVLLPGSVLDPEVALSVRSDALRYDLLSGRNRSVAGFKSAIAGTFEAQFQMYWNPPTWDLSGLRIATEGSVGARTFLAETGSTSTYGDPVTDKAVLNYQNDHLMLGDLNTGLTNPVALSTTAAAVWVNALPSELQNESLLGAVHGNHLGGDLPTSNDEYASLQPGVMHFANTIGPVSDRSTVSEAGVDIQFINLSFFATVTAGTLTILSPGDVIRARSTDAQGRPTWRYHTVSNIVGPTITLGQPWGGDTVTVSSPDWARVDNPLDIVIPETAVVVGGVKHIIPETIHTHSGAPTEGGLYYNAGTGSFSVTTAPSVDNDSVFLCFITGASYAVFTVQPMALKPRSADGTKVVTVGDNTAALNGTLARDLPDFRTLGEALLAIEAWEYGSGAGPDGGGWTVRIVGGTTEADDEDRGLGLPYNVPCDGLRIVGPGKSAVAPAVSWSAATGLLHLNEKSGLTLEGVNAVYGGTVGGVSQRVRSGSPEVALVTNQRETGVTGFGNVENLSLSGCRVTAAGLLSMSEIEGGSGAVVRDCWVQFEDLAVFWDGSQLTAPNTSLLVDGCNLVQSGAGSTIGGASAVRVENAGDVRVNNCDIEIDESARYGLYVQWGRGGSIAPFDGSFTAQGVRIRVTNSLLNSDHFPLVYAELDDNGGVSVPFSCSGFVLDSTRGRAIRLTGTQTGYSAVFADTAVRIRPGLELLNPVVHTDLPGVRLTNVSVDQGGGSVVPNESLFYVEGPGSLLHGCAAVANGDGAEAPFFYVDSWTGASKLSRLESCVAVLLDNTIPDGGADKGVFYVVDAELAGCRIEGTVPSPPFGALLDRTSDVGFNLWGNRARIEDCFADGAKIVCRSEGQVVTGCVTEGGSIYAYVGGVIANNRLAQSAGGGSPKLGSIFVGDSDGPQLAAPTDARVVISGNNLVCPLDFAQRGTIDATNASNSTIVGNNTGNVITAGAVGTSSVANIV